jgi:hypothetical protein
MKKTTKSSLAHFLPCEDIMRSQQSTPQQRALTRTMLISDLGLPFTKTVRNFC